MTLASLMEREIGIYTEQQDADPDSALHFLYMEQCQYDQHGKAWPEDPQDEPWKGTVRGECMVALALDGGHQQIQAATRMYILRAAPAAAVLVWTSWGAKLPPGKTLRDYGVDEVRKLPRQMLWDYLHFDGQDLMGMQMHRTFVARKNDWAPGWRWVLEENARFSGNALSPMQPLYVFDQQLKTAREEGWFELAVKMGLSPAERDYRIRQGSADALSLAVNWTGRRQTQQRKRDRSN